MKSLIFAIILVVYLLGSSGSPVRDFDARLRSIVKPYLFSIAGWEVKALALEANQWLSGNREDIDGEVQLVTGYFASIERINALKSEVEVAGAANGESVPSLLEELNRLQEQNTALTGTVERIIEEQIREALVQQGIFNPVDEHIGLMVGFPPVNFRLEKTPGLLVISPRERIESIREIMLVPGLTREEIADIEAGVDGLDVSSLVVGLGGSGVTYPTLVTNQASLRDTIDITTEEWLHQYLAFKPLGFRYLLDLIGLSRNYDIAIMNETLAGMVSKEIGSLVYEKYYAGCEGSSARSQAPESETDFNYEMREIRRAVDSYLARGEIEQAEEFMEQKRQYLASLGYHIGKLNQAYFAFYGTYADSPTSICPIGLELESLRAQSTSLKDFLNTAAAMTSRQQLTGSIK